LGARAFPLGAVIAELAIAGERPAARRAGEHPQQRVPVGAQAPARRTGLPGVLAQPGGSLGVRPVGELRGVDGEVRGALTPLVDVPDGAVLLDPPPKAKGAGVDGVPEEVDDV